MAIDLATHQIFTIRLKDHPPQTADIHAEKYRELRLQSLKESPESFTESYSEAVKRPPRYWKNVIKKKVGANGMILLLVALPRHQASDIPQAQQSKDEIEIWALETGKLLGMAVYTGPIPQERFLAPKGSSIPLNRSDGEEMRFHGSQFYFIPEVRGERHRGPLFLYCENEANAWFLDCIKSAGTHLPPVVRFRAHLKPGRFQEGLIEFYRRRGWFISGKTSWRNNVLAELGEEGVRQAEARGDDMDVEGLVIERITPAAHLEWWIERNKRVLRKFEEDAGLVNGNPGRPQKL